MKSYVYIALAVIILAFVKWYSDRQYQAGYDSATSSYEIKLREANERTEAARIEGQTAINSITQLWLERPPEIEVRHEEIVKYVDVKPECNATRGAVRLLNNAADPNRVQTAFHPTLTDDQARDASTVSQRELVKTCGGWATDYNRVSSQLTTLQKVVTKSNCFIIP